MNENNTNTEKTSSPKENYLYREEDENYAKNNSPSLSVASTVGDDIDENLLKPSSSKSKSQEALNSQQKILNMIEGYLNRNSDENSLK